MARDDKEKVVLEGQKAIDLWLQGREAWNKWVEENPIADVSFIQADFTKYKNISFKNFKFPNGKVTFERSRFGIGRVNFKGANFGDSDVSFFEANFEKGDVDFSFVTFGKGSVDFSNVEFGEGFISFDHSSFGDGNVDFTNSQFGKGIVIFSNAEFGEGDVDFSDSTFENGNVDFEDINFGTGEVSFTGVDFGVGWVSYFNSIFNSGDVFFSDCKFGEGLVNFSQIKLKESDIFFGFSDLLNAKFKCESAKISGQFNFHDIANVDKLRAISFKHTTFETTVDLDNNEFKCIPDFTNTKLSNHLILSNFYVNAEKKPSSRLISKVAINIYKLWFGEKVLISRVRKAININERFINTFKASWPWLTKSIVVNKDDIERLRRLKELADINKHHQLALDLHIEEMKCSRWIETPWQKLPIEFLFQKCGDYGRSIFRPIISLVLLWLSFAPIYASDSSKKDVWADALLFSFSQMFSLIPSSKDARTESSKELYGAVVDGKVIVDIPNYVFGLAGLQSIASIALVFLVGLALRNRFRI